MEHKGQSHERIAFVLHPAPYTVSEVINLLSQEFVVALEAGDAGDDRVAVMQSGPVMVVMLMPTC